jgi:transposase
MSKTPSEIDVLRAALAAAESRASAAEGALAAAKDELSQVHSVVSASEDMIRQLRLQIAKLRREQYGHSGERHARLIEQLEDLETDLGADRAMAEVAPAKTTVAAFERRRPARKPFPDYLPRERVVIEAPAACTCCGSVRIVKMGEDITETLEVIPWQWKVIQAVREKFTCRDCETISQPPAPFHPTPRGWAGPNLLAMVLFEKFGQHQPLNRQAERYAKEGVEISLSTLADQVGACAMALQPIHDLLQPAILVLERLQPTHLVRQQAAISLLPVEICHLTDPRLATDLRDRRAFLALLQDERLLRLREPRCLHANPLLSQPGKRSGKLQLQGVQSSGGRALDCCNQIWNHHVCGPRKGTRIGSRHIRIRPLALLHSRKSVGSRHWVSCPSLLNDTIVYSCWNQPCRRPGLV